MGSIIYKCEVQGGNLGRLLNEISLPSNVRAVIRNKHLDPSKFGKMLF